MTSVVHVPMVNHIGHVTSRMNAGAGTRHFPVILEMVIQMTAMTRTVMESATNTLALQDRVGQNSQERLYYHPALHPAPIASPVMKPSLAQDVEYITNVIWETFDLRRNVALLLYSTRLEIIANFHLQYFVL
jgi:hypothetical protein